MRFSFPKTYRANVGWALSTGATLALIANTANAPRSIVALAIFGALGFLWSAWEHGWLRRKPRSIFIVTSVLGLFSCITWFAWPPPALSQITIEIGNTLNSKKAFQTRFLLTNRNAYHIHDVTYICEAWDGKTGPGPLIADVDTTVIPDLPAGQSRSLYCEFAPISISSSVENSETPVLQIWIYYFRGKEKDNSGFRFFAKRSEDGTYTWFPAGPAEIPKPPQAALGTFVLPSKSKTSSIDKTWSATPASIAGVTRSIWWTRQKL
jgi:hypothetical protein